VNDGDYDIDDGKYGFDKVDKDHDNKDEYGDG
jgi:hypothetical protein